jgi:hypothetical protein
MKKVPKRFEDAVTKLYNAFHNGDLEAGNCSKCAVGNMCDNNANWSDLFLTANREMITDNGDIINQSIHLFAKEGQIISRSFLGAYGIFNLKKAKDCFPPTFLLSTKIMKEDIPRKTKWEMQRDQAVQVIEKTGYSQEQLAAIEAVFEKTVKKNTEEQQFQGLCAVIELLCQFEGITNVMDYKSLFEYDKEEVKQLNEVF